MQIVGMLAAAVGIQGSVAAARGGDGGTAEEVLAGQTSRWKMMLSAVLIGTVSVIAVLVRDRGRRRR